MRKDGQVLPQDGIFWRFPSAYSIPDEAAVSRLGGLPPASGPVGIKCGCPWPSQGPAIPMFLSTWRRWAVGPPAGDTGARMLPDKNSNDDGDSDNQSTDSSHGQGGLY